MPRLIVSLTLAAALLSGCASAPLETASVATPAALSLAEGKPGCPS